MVHVDVEYQGKLRCEAVHQPSSTLIHTDAPVDNHGLGESFSPTDLVATALASCIATIMGIVAERNEVDLSGLKIEMPIASDHPQAEMLKKAALACPVHKSLHPDIEMPIDWVWQ